MLHQLLGRVASAGHGFFSAAVKVVADLACALDARARKIGNTDRSPGGEGDLFRLHVRR